ncbi:glutathione S-transferase Mu 1-like [Tropilaelaps mercedesae]|uniref:Glutathione S-transferase n=1 Tax=Tropilaelaps mercedesae TaxID=418985 RepID=A0A1V9XH37_9ACAR|nr:glutathione S-transferase Mu 1-like [Tropilaelaps mercedesae]
MKLGYWDIRGLAQPIRFLLAYKEVDYEDKRYSCGPPPDFDKSQWLDEKFTLGLDFPNLPYLIDGDVKLTQSLAILRYLARKFDLDGQSCEEKRRVELVEQQLADFRMNWVRLCYSPKFTEERDAYEQSLPNNLKAFSEYLGERPFFAGDRLTYVDFLVYEMLAQHFVFSKTSFANFKNLTDFIDRIEALPTLKKYLDSETCIKWPFNGYRHWHADLRLDDTPLEAGLGFTCKLRSDTPFLGRTALEEQKKRGLRKCITCFTVDEHVPLIGLEAIYRNDKPVGFLRRADFGFALNKSIGYGYVTHPDPDGIASMDWLVSGEYALENRGRTIQARLHTRSPFDPLSRRVKGIYDTHTARH